MNGFVDNEEFEGGVSNENEERQETGKLVSMEEHKQKKPIFAYWEIGDEKLKLKLTTPQTLELEKKYRRNLISMLGDEDNIPPLTTMLQVIHAAAEPWKQGLKLKHVMELYDRYVDQYEGSQLKLYADVYIQIFMVSGFFSNSMVEDLTDSMESVQKKIE
jgi:hypothetical protein